MAHRIHLTTRNPLTLWPGPHRMMLARVLHDDNGKPTIHISVLEDTNQDDEDGANRKPTVTTAHQGDTVELGPWTFHITSIITDGDSHATAILDRNNPDS